MNRTRVAVFAAAVATAMTALLPSGASAASGPTALERCTTAALERGATLWTCVGGTLTYLPAARLDSAGERVESSTPKEGSEWTTEVIATDRRPSTLLGGTGVMPLGNGDAWDTWCEAGSICSRKITSYISETKGNGAYGNQNGAIGAFDLILRTNLNGGQPQYTVGINHDSGPLLRVYATVNCVWDKLFDGTCGHFPISEVYVGNYRSPVIYGNRVPSSGTYFSTLTGTFTPDGYGNMRFATLQTEKFRCSTASNCTF